MVFEKLKFEKIGKITIIIEPSDIPIPSRIKQFIDPERYGDSALNIRNTLIHFNEMVGKNVAGLDDWIGTYPNGWGEDWAARLSELKPLFQEGLIRELALSWVPNIEAINSGSEDDYIKTVALEIKMFQYPILLRLGAEMNLRQWEPTGFISMWKRIVDIFRSLNVANVTWVWNPNCQEGDDKTYHWTQYYPGDSYVDVVGIDMYQYNDIIGDWDEPENLIKGIYNDYWLKKPIAICEWGVNAWFMTGSDTPDEVQADWMTKFFNAISIRTISWISYHYTQNWKFDNRPLTLAVYRSRI